jgi:hypothetical protein
MKNILQKSCVVLLTVTIMFGIAPRPAHALFGMGDIVLDPGNLVQNTLTAIKSVTGCDLKECALDPLAWFVAKIAIQSMTKSVVNWINSGFHGSPAFVGDLEGHLQVVGDAAAYGFLKELTTNAAINSPFRSQIVKAAALGYYAATSKDAYFQVNTYTLNRFTTNDKAFLAGDFSKGGWGAWYGAWMNPQNNPYGASMAIGDAINARVTATKDKTMVQLNWGQGFLSWCGDVDVNKDGVSGSVDETETVEVTALKSTDPSGCTKSDGTPGQTQTPGTVIQTQLNQTLGLNGNTLVTADEFDEIIGALMSQLVNQVVGSSGLRGVASVSSGGSGFIDLATDPSQLSTGGSSVTSSMSNTVSSQITQVTNYQDAWKKIGDEAGLAKTALANCLTATEASSTEVANTISKAETANVKSTAALSALQNMKTKIAGLSTGSGSSATQGVTDMGTELQTLISGPTMPTATELSDAQLQSQDSGTNPNPTLYTKMKNIIDGCPLRII